MALCEKNCIPCRGGVPALTKAEAEPFMPQAPDWILNESGTAISRKFVFKNFAEAMSFAQRVGNLSEQEGHHPQITIGWGYCTVVFTTHKIRGLHENDFIMAAKVSELTRTPTAS